MIYLGTCSMSASVNVPAWQGGRLAPVHARETGDRLAVIGEPAGRALLNPPLTWARRGCGLGLRPCRPTSSRMGRVPGAAAGLVYLLAGLAPLRVLVADRVGQHPAEGGDAEAGLCGHVDVLATAGQATP